MPPMSERVGLAYAGASRAVPSCRCVASLASHQVVNVLIPRPQPVRRGGGGCQDLGWAVGLLPFRGVNVRWLRLVGFGGAVCRLLNRRAGGCLLDKPQPFRYLVENAHVCFTSAFCGGDKGDRGDKPGLRGL